MCPRSSRRTRDRARRGEGEPGDQAGRRKGPAFTPQPRQHPGRLCSAPQPRPRPTTPPLRASTTPISCEGSAPRFNAPLTQTQFPEGVPPPVSPPVNVTSGARPGEVPPFSPHATGRKCPRLVVGARQCFPADAPLPSSVTAQRGSRGVQAGTPASLQGSGCAPAVWCTQGWGGTCLALSGRG